MSTAHDDLLKSALTLPEAERILLATELLDSIPGKLPGLSVGDLLNELEAGIHAMRLRVGSAPRLSHGYQNIRRCL